MNRPWYTNNVDDLIVLNALLIFSVATILIVRLVLRHFERKRVQLALITAAEKGAALTPEVLKILSGGASAPPPKPVPQLDLRKGVIWLSVAAGMAVFGFSLVLGHDPKYLYLPIKDPFAALGIAALPASIGIGYIVLWLIGRNGSTQLT